MALLAAMNLHSAETTRFAAQFYPTAVMARLVGTLIPTVAGTIVAPRGFDVAAARARVGALIGANIFLDKVLLANLGQMPRVNSHTVHALYQANVFYMPNPDGTRDEVVHPISKPEVAGIIAGVARTIQQLEHYGLARTQPDGTVHVDPVHAALLAASVRMGSDGQPESLQDPFVLASPVARCIYPRSSPIRVTVQAPATSPHVPDPSNWRSYTTFGGRMQMEQMFGFAAAQARQDAAQSE